jgi:hypothetical protein
VPLCRNPVASRAGLDYPYDPVRSTVIALALLVRLALPALAADDAQVQTITPVEPAVEQRVEAVGGGEQQVEPLSAEQLQNIAGAPKQSTARRVAGTAGKVVLGVAALGISLGFTVASLLFF